MNQPPPSSSRLPDQISSGNLGNLDDELDTVANRSFLAELTQFSVLTFSGDDAQGFLQGQLSCDVDALAGGQNSSYGSYSTAKGRMLASFLLWRDALEWRMLLHRSIAPAIQKRLAMFVLRAKVKIEDHSSRIALMGIGGPAAGASLHTLYGALPEGPHQLQSTTPGNTLVALPGQRWLLVLASEHVQATREKLASALHTVGSSTWDWSEIRNGIPWVTAQTQDQFVPQMANLELIGGVNFKKGCYPGQEIVARTQYLGKLKRRLYLAHVDALASAGDELYSDDVGGQNNGMIANAAPSPGGGCDVLAVVQSTSADTGAVHLKSADGPRLRFLPLPYAVPESAKS